MDFDLIESNRMKAMREAFWLNTPEGHDDLQELKYVLVESGISEKPTHEELKKFFMQIPDEIFGRLILWGIVDTEVLNSLYHFAAENKSYIISTLRQCNE